MTPRAMTASSPRAARAALTREAIVAAARDLFVARGYRSTSLRDIAAEAGISHPGLLKHFASKDAVLIAVVERFEEDNELDLLARLEGDEAGALRFSTVAARNETVPGYLALFAALAGEASAPSHPAHAHMRRRYAMLREAAADAIDEAIRHDVVSPDRSPLDEAVRFAAAWDGLQLIAQYLPDRADVVDMLEQHEALLALPVGARDSDDPGPRMSGERAPVPAMPAFGATAADETGYRVGRDRRAQIVTDATALFAREGYGDTSLADIARAVGVSKSTLLHHYPTKDTLLSAVLVERDRSIESRSSYVRRSRCADELRDIPIGAAENDTDSPGLTEVYAVLSCEAAPPEHPAHAYFAERFAITVDHFTALFRGAQADGDLPAHRDPEAEGLWLTALWDGLQYQWLYDRDSVDVASHLRAHLDDVLPREGG